MKIYTQSKIIIGDHLTPIAAFNNLRDHFEGVSLFESSDYHDRRNSKSFICANPIVTVEVLDGRLLAKDKAGRSSNEVAIDSNDIERLLNNYTFENQEKAALNGFFGVFGYDAVPLVEDIKFSPKRRFKELAEVQLKAYEFVLIFDNFNNEIEVLYNSFSQGDYDFNSILNHLQVNHSIQAYFKANTEIEASVSEEEYLDLIRKAKCNISNGDVFQLVLSRSFSQRYSGDEFQVYRALRSLNPSPYMFYLNLGKATLLGASPEAHIVVKNGEAEIHPIAGTFKKVGIKDVDEASKISLSNDPKENAEHNMLVDLARNDLNVACSDVEVRAFKEIQEFSHVIHMVSKVTGKTTRTGGFSLNVFAKTFPAGTLSGAPKYKAMELIDAYENQNRGFYGGVVGQFAPNGDVNAAIVIRSCLCFKGSLNYQAGAGIVANSNPKMELEEIYNKVGAVKTAIQNANQLS